MGVSQGGEELGGVVVVGVEEGVGVGCVVGEVVVGEGGEGVVGSEFEVGGGAVGVEVVGDLLVVDVVAGLVGPVVGVRASAGSAVVMRGMVGGW
ncbi:hypothetical protein ACFQ2B_38885 [Streptomyces stramineus]